MNKNKYDCKRYKLLNVVYIENIPFKYLYKKYLIEQLSQYGKIEKITINSSNKVIIEYYSNFSASLCIKYINNFKLLTYKNKYCNIKCSYYTITTKPIIDEFKDYEHNKLEPIREKTNDNIFPFVEDHEKNNPNIIKLSEKFFIGTGGIFNSLWIDNLEDTNVNFVPKIKLNDEDEKYFIFDEEEEEKEKEIENNDEHNINLFNNICIGTGGIFNYIWTNGFNSKNIYFVPNVINRI